MVLSQKADRVLAVARSSNPSKLLEHGSLYGRKAERVSALTLSSTFSRLLGHGSLFRRKADRVSIFARSTKFSRLLENGSAEAKLIESQPLQAAQNVRCCWSMVLFAET